MHSDAIASVQDSNETVHSRAPSPEPIDMQMQREFSHTSIPVIMQCKKCSAHWYIIQVRKICCSYRLLPILEQEVHPLFQIILDPCLVTWLTRLMKILQVGDPMEGNNWIVINITHNRKLVLITLCSLQPHNLTLSISRLERMNIIRFEPEQSISLLCLPEDRI